jgi:hypothetical protein
VSAALLVLPVGAAEAAQKPKVEQTLVRRAPELIRHFQEHKYRNVGVLKFLVCKDGKRPSDCVGTLNMLLARRLELALILADDPRKPVGIIRNASAVAARLRGANHLTPAGRRALFAPEYTRAWGDREVKADAFVTGLVDVNKDLSTLTIGLLVFDRENTKLRPLGKDMVASNDSIKLGEMGESFMLRWVKDDLGDDASRREHLALGSAAKLRRDRTGHPLAGGSRGRPVSLEVRYDGKPVALTFRDGRAYLPEPSEGQKVSFVLRRDDSRETYGVVLKVNGENTLFRQREPDLHCNRWVLAPGAGPLVLRGYQVSEDTVEEFRVLPQVESKEREVHYGEDVGTITLTVFRDRGKAEPPMLLTRAQSKEAAVAAARLPRRSAANLHALKAQLLEEANRGLIEPGARTPGKVRRVKFNPDPTPVMTATIVYYRP